ncbi:fimbrial protein [Pseudomonas putida]|uniref:fimbrial protein n=1 Tax=Pseudomonas putida TaxID=303 RepID=UPI001F526299|nr:fimbrial protein [Pseudomonas putida]MCI0910851.1 type 1 fimbrial protein [Pseudomonas putida]
MKRIYAALALGLIGNTAFASNIINFEGTVSTGGTCPIDVVTPGGPSLPQIHLGDFRTDDFKAIGDQTGLVKFALRVDPMTCTIGAGEQGYVTYKPNYGTDPSGQMYGLQSGVGYSSGLSLVIYDEDGAPVEPNTESKGYLLSDSVPTDMNFITRLQMTDYSVTEGHIRTSVNYLVDIR